MRLLYVSQGVTGHDLRFTALIAGAGHEVHYLALDPLGAGDVPALPGGVRWETWGDRPLEPVRTPSAAAALLAPFLRVVERVRPDALHAGPVPTSGLLAARAGGIPRVVVSWGSDVLVDAGRDEDWADATREALGAADLFVCDSDAVLRRARDFAPLPDECVIRFPWGTDLKRFSPVGEPTPLRQRLEERFGDCFLVLCTRSWEPIYGIDTLLEGFRRAQRREPRLRMVMLGSGSLAPEVEAWIDNGAMHDLVLRPGIVSHTELPEWFRTADLYASCARSDGTSVSLLEAMASGLPVVVTDIPSNREWVTPEENGWLARAGDTGAVADALARAATTSPDALAAMGRRNRQLTEQRADWPAVALPLLTGYAHLEERAATVGEAAS
jgi:L-malate glycosyltransferase